MVKAAIGVLRRWYQGCARLGSGCVRADHHPSDARGVQASLGNTEGQGHGVDLSQGYIQGLARLGLELRYDQGQHWL